ncbi:MAG: isoprenylcysteine carboxyl methyltransferase family protein [Candidatus Eiseniibacteriota bacterium]
MPAIDPRVPLGVFLGLLIAQRAYELMLSARHARFLRTLGGVEWGRGHFLLLVALHALWPLCLTLEVLALGARIPSSWPIWLALFALGQFLRLWAIRTLGPFWTVRVWVVPGTTPVRRGPYRYLRHPNYLGVALELLAAPLFFGAWRTAVFATLANVLVLAIRIRVEERALAWGAADGANVSGRPA